MPETAGRRMQLTRRGVLALGIGALATACTADPRIGGGAPTDSPRPTTGRGSASAQPQPTPTFAGGTEAARSELSLAGRIDGVAARWRSRLDADAEDLLVRLAAAHRSHAAALSSPEPTTRPTAPGASPVPQKPSAESLDAALADLSTREEGLAAAHRERALAATGFSALLWASMAVAATGFATAMAEVDGDEVPSFAKAPTRHELPTLTDTAAIQDLVTQLHAAVYGYQLAIGQLDSGASKDRALARLKEHRRLRDTLIGLLTTRKAKVPVPAPAYEPSVRPDSPDRAGRLIRSMERALLPFTGLWLASAPQPADRAQAYAAMLATDTAARSWGAGLLVWPGWNG